MKLYALTSSAPNFSLTASTRGLDHGSCCGPLGFAGAAGAAGLAPGGGGGGLGAAAFGSPAGGGGGGVGFGGSAAFSAGFSVCWLSFCSSATFNVLGRNQIVTKSGRYTKTWIQPHASISVNAL